MRPLPGVTLASFLSHKVKKIVTTLYGRFAGLTHLKCAGENTETAHVHVFNNALTYSITLLAWIRQEPSRMNLGEPTKENPSATYNSYCIEPRTNLPGVPENNSPSHSMLSGAH